jgi:hypothetical protein
MGALHSGGGEGLSGMSVRGLLGGSRGRSGGGAVGFLGRPAIHDAHCRGSMVSDAAPDVPNIP